MSRIAIVPLALCFLVVVVAGASAESRDKLKKKFEARIEKLQEYKDAGKVGADSRRALQNLSTISSDGLAEH